MSRYLSAEWVQSFNAALAGIDLTEAVAEAGASSLKASDGAFAVTQVVRNVPEDVSAASGGGGGGGGGGEIRTVLTVVDGRATFELDPDRTGKDLVAIVLDYEDALAMARGQLDPADALAAGRVRVRGDLAVLVAGQAVLAAAAAQLGPAFTDLTG